MSVLLERLATRIPASVRDLDAIARTACFRYKTYEIPKRSGHGFRTIAQPAPEVKWIQSVVVEEIISDWPIHSVATAYRKKTSTADHAAMHAKARFLLKLDFADFFPSIKSADVAMHVAAYSPHLSPADQRLLVNILTWRNKRTGTQCLSIGAPSSPFVSNSMMNEFDLQLDLICRKSEVTYSRYADDLALSTNRENVLVDIFSQIQRLLHRLGYPRLRLNPEKTLNVSKRNHRSLVGLTLTPEGSVSIGRNKKRLLRSQIHWFSTQQLKAEDEAKLRGMLAYVLSVEPVFVARMAKLYGEDVLARLGVSSSAIQRRSR
ncbi:MAG: retron St85 family RNA-directed DNA polymerase [Burkholderiales bacterium]